MKEAGQISSRRGVLLAVVALFALSGCDSGGAGGDAGATDAPDSTPAAGDAASKPGAPGGRADSPGKPTAPIDISYRIIGKPVVGQPLSIDLQVSSPLRDRGIDLHYRINDTRTLSFPQGQPVRVTVGSLGDAPHARQQVTVVPQRSGRTYLNVSAEIETEGGTMIKSMAIPIHAGEGSGEGSEQQPANGEPKQDADGEPVISLPADET